MKRADYVYRFTYNYKGHGTKRFTSWKIGDTQAEAKKRLLRDHPDAIHIKMTKRSVNY